MDHYHEFAALIPQCSDRIYATARYKILICTLPSIQFVRSSTSVHCASSIIPESEAKSRYLLACEGQESTKEAGAFTVFEAVFKEYGLPDAIRRLPTKEMGTLIVIDL